MTRKVVYGPEAEEQLAQVLRYISSESSPVIARRFVASIIDKCDSLAEFPDRGTPRGDVRAGLRTIAFRRRVVIAYAVEPRQVLILGIFYGGQDFETILAAD